MKLTLDQYALDTRYSLEPHVPEFALRSDTYMESDSGKRAKEFGVRDRRFSCLEGLVSPVLVFAKVLP